MVSAEVSINLDKESKLMIKDQMAIDLSVLLESYRNKDIGLRLISEKTGIGEKTLKRIQAAKSDPHYNTIKRFYDYFLKIATVRDEKFHSYIKNLIEAQMSAPLKNEGTGLEARLLEDKIFRHIFLISRTGSISREWVIGEYGRYGMETLELMLKNDILIESDKGIYSQGPVGITKGPETLGKIICDLVSEHLRLDLLSLQGENSAFYVVEGISSQAKLEILNLIEKFKSDAISIAFDPDNRGDERIFLATVFDNFIVHGHLGRLN